MQLRHAAWGSTAASCAGGPAGPGVGMNHDPSRIVGDLDPLEKPGSVRRCWKGFRFEILDSLAEEGLISGGRGQSRYTSLK